MINLYDGQITDLLPDKIKADTNVQCISYAVQQEKQRILLLANRTRTLSVIDELPESILDILAVELRTPYYQTDMDLATKRNIIKKTLLWHTKAGTPSAVEELVEIVFGEGKVVEWFDYDEGPYTPGTFDIITNARMTEDIAEYFLSIIQRVKNTRSHIRRILVEREMEMHETVASGAATHPEVPVLNHHQESESQSMNETVGAGVTTAPSETVTNAPQGRTEHANRADRAAAGAVSHPSEIIGNNVAPRQEVAGNTIYAGAQAKSETAIIILNGNLVAELQIRQKAHGMAGIAASHSTITI